jgi:hypothetical protein
LLNAWDFSLNLVSLCQRELLQHRTRELTGRSLSTTRVIFLSEITSDNCQKITSWNFNIYTQADTGAPAGRHYYEKASTLSDLCDEAIEALVEYGATCTSPWSQILIQHVHGAASRVGPTETAFAQRGESYVICMIAAWDGGQASQHMVWTRACWKALEQYATSGVYVNFLGQEEEGRVRAAYGVNYQRLVALKNTYDPCNVFHLNQNIKPTATGSITTSFDSHAMLA